MRIVQLANFYSPTSGGLRTALGELARHYVAAGHEVVRIVPGARSSRTNVDGVEVHTVKAPRLGGTGYRCIVDRAAVAAILDRVAPDVIELSDRSTLVGVAAAARTRGVKVVFIAHERLDSVMTSRVRSRLLARMLTDRWNRYVGTRVDAVVCASNFAAAEWTRVRHRLVRRIPLGVNLDVFRPGVGDSCPTLSGGRVQLVCVGRLSPEKRPELAIETVRELVARGVGVTLRLLGDGPMRADLEERAAGLPVHFLGHVGRREEVVEHLRSASAVLAVCPVETFGLAALEAMACGAPVVMTSGGALAELGAPGASVVAEPTAAGFADAVSTIVRSDRRIASIFARAHAERFPWHRTANEMLGLMSELAAVESPRILSSLS